MTASTPLAAVRLRATHDALPIAYAPGRVNLIGGHVDSHEGRVVSMAIDRGVAVGYTPRTDRRIVATSDGFDGTADLDLDHLGGATTPAWGRLLAAVAAELHTAGVAVRGADLRMSADLVAGGGLSSSAACTVAVTLALLAAADTAPPEPTVLAEWCRRAEHAATGVPCGLHDPLAIATGRAGAALLIDFRAVSVEPIPLPASIDVLVVDSGVRRTLEGSPWARRHADAHAIATKIGVASLRDADIAAVADEPRARHVVTEIDRVGRFAAALAHNDLEAAGALMVASHESSRKDFETSTNELDAIVAACLDAGAYGARLSGGGFGGCCVAITPAGTGTAIGEQVVARYEAEFEHRAASFLVGASDRARYLD